MDQGHPFPVVGVSACRKIHDVFPGHWAAETYMAALVAAAACATVIIPAMAQRGFPDGAVEGIVARLDGLMLTGSPSNIEPHHYGGMAFDEDLNDPDRDATTLPLVRAAVGCGVPVFAICRGIQELNVAMGGSLYQRVHETPGRRDHRSDKTKPKLERGEYRHKVAIKDEGLLRAILDADTVTVNSLHAQAIRDLAPGARINAVAEDGTIEAVDFPGSPGFVLGVQWHPEVLHEQDFCSQSLFLAFGQAVHAYAGSKIIAPGRLAAE